MKKTARLLLAAALPLVGLSTSAHAQLISSESFWTSTTNPPPSSQYLQGSIASTVSGYDNTIVLAGNSGFNATAGRTWQNGTGGVQVTTVLSLTHNGLVGGSQDGSVRWQPFNSTIGDRASSRRLASTPTTSASYFMSGLIRGTTPTENGEAGTAGFMASGPASNAFNISTGIHMGLHMESGDLKIAAFANNATHNLLNLGSSGPALTTTYQVVLRLDVAASGDDTLTAWYAANGDTSLTQALAPTNVGNIWSSAASLEFFALQTRGAGSTSSQLLGNFDEMRFGTTLASVTAIPEPSTWALLAGSLTALVIFRRRRSGQVG